MLVAGDALVLFLLLLLVAPLPLPLTVATIEGAMGATDVAVVDIIPDDGLADVVSSTPSMASPAASRPLPTETLLNPAWRGVTVLLALTGTGVL